jgi:arsenite/tail-anchored protein-transporting ATPase
MSLFDQKLIFFGGKGGVGKTTCASAFAILASQKGRKTLLVSTDLAHSLSDIFQRPIGNRETELQPNLYGLEINPDDEVGTYIQKIKSGLSQRLNDDMKRSFIQQLDLAATSPGTQEAALFDKVTDLIIRIDQDYDLLVFDTAPTGQTLRLLTLPELMGSWIETLTKRRKKVFSLWKMFSRASQNPIDDDPILMILEKRREKFTKAKKILIDASQTSFYLVLIPERLPILETQKAIPILKQHRIPIRGMIVNRLLPEDSDSAYIQRRKDQEKSYLKEIEMLFKSFRPAYLRQRESDVMNLEGLREVAKELDPALNQIGPLT